MKVHIHPHQDPWARDRIWRASDKGWFLCSEDTPQLETCFTYELTFHDTPPPDGPSVHVIAEPYDAQVWGEGKVLADGAIHQVFPDFWSCIDLVDAGAGVWITWKVTGRAG